MRRHGLKRSLVIPMYREATRIRDTIAALAGSSLASSDVELIFVDDGSDDGTPEVVIRALEEAGLPARVLRLTENAGKGAAVRAGVLESSGESVAFADADLSAGVTEIERCFRLVEAGGCEVVAATRGAPLSNITVPQPRVRRLSGKLFNVLLRCLALTRLADTQCGLKAFTRHAARELFDDMSVTRFAFDVEVLLKADLCGMVVRELPIEWRHVEESRVRGIKDSARMIRDVVRLRSRLVSGAELVSERGMSAGKLDVMAKVERDHWWFRGKRDLLVQELRTAGAGGALAVDVGCGTGEVVRRLNGLPFDLVVGTDSSEYALSLARKESDQPLPLVVSEAGGLPLPTGAASCVTMLDVLEHLDDDVGALRELAGLVEPGGAIVVAVPAYTWAWSDHDVVLGHRRRYTRRRLVEVASAAGLIVERCTYYYSWLVPIAFAVRRTPLRRFLKGEAEEASFVNPTVNRALGMVNAVERAACRRFDLPFGLSVMLVARPAAQGDQASA